MKKRKGKYDTRNKLNNLTGSEWLSNSTSIWTSEGKDELVVKDFRKLIELFTKEKSAVGIIDFKIKQKSISGRKILQEIKDKKESLDYLIINDPLLKSNNIIGANKDLFHKLNVVIENKKSLKLNKYVSFYINESIIDGTNLNVSYYIHEAMRNNGFRFKGRVNVIFQENNVGNILHFKLVDPEQNQELPKKYFKKNSSKKINIPSELNALRSKVKTDEIGKRHPAPFSPIDVEKLISHFTKEGDTVLDPFVGVGSTTLAAINTNRKSIGIDLNEEYIDLAHKRTGIKNKEKNHKLIVGNSLKEITKLTEFDYCITSPPYHNILKNKGAGVRHDNSQFRQGIDYYSENSEDLGNQESLNSYREFFQKIIMETFKKLKHGSFLSIVVSDFTVERVEQDIVGQLISDIEKTGFIFKKNIILTQNFKAIFPFGYPYDYVINHVNQYIVNFYKK
jgi:DNA modification methylase